MIQPNVLIASTSNELSASLTNSLSDTCKLAGVRLRTGSDHPLDKQQTFGGAVELLSFLSQQPLATLCETMVILDLGVGYEAGFFSRSSSSSYPWHRQSLPSVGVALELVLRFPQVFPVFLSPLFNADNLEFSEWSARLRADAGDRSNDWFQLHYFDSLSHEPLMRLIKRFSEGLRGYFDPSGLRTLLRNRFLAQVFGGANEWSNTAAARGILNSRLERCAVIVEEESELALLTAYSAYKMFGRVWVVTTYSEFRGEGESCHWRNEQKARQVVVVRDLDLRFPDFPDSEDGAHSLRVGLHDINSTDWGALPPNYTVRAMSQHRSVAMDSRGWRAEDVRLGQSRNGQQFLGIRKPLVSIYGAAALFGADKADSLIAHLRPASDPEKPLAHGAPYQNLRIALDLLDQSDAYRQIQSAKSDLLAALMAEEAYSLLLGMSSLACFRALRGIHLSEARAEGDSLGMTHAVAIEDRRQDLEHTMVTLNPMGGDASFLARLWAELRLAYRETEQFRASEAANSESLIHSSWLPGEEAKWARSIKRHILGYFTSIPRLIWLFFLWSFALTAIHAGLAGWTFSPTFAGVGLFLDIYHHVIASIIRGNDITSHGIGGDSPLQAVADVLTAFSSLVFVGLVVTVIFRKTTRG